MAEERLHNSLLKRLKTTPNRILLFSLPFTKDWFYNLYMKYKDETKAEPPSVKFLDEYADYPKEDDK